MRFDLNSPSLAQYHWGTLFCRFSPNAPIARNTYIQILAYTAAGVAPWRTDDEFRVTAALLHEIVHLAQDLTTGIGHWDYMSDSRSTHAMLRYASAVRHFD